MRKQKLNKFLNSIVKSHGDVEEDKKEIENNVRKMLELFENKSADVSHQSDLVSLINDINKRFHSLYGRHDGLIGKIKRKVRHRNSESCSDSSDSGSESSSDDNASNNFHGQEMEQQIPLDYRSLQETLNMMSVRNAELEAQNSEMHAMLEERQIVLTNLESDLKTLGESFKPLQVDKEFLLSEVERSKEREGKLSLSLRSLQDEKEVLMIEKQNNSSMILQTEETLKKLKVELEMIIEETGKVRDENGFLSEELEKTAQEVIILNQKLTAIHDEKESSTTVAENLQLENENLKSQLEASIKQVSHLSDRLREELEKTAHEVLILKATESERDMLIEEKSVLLVNINESTAIQGELKAQIEQVEGEKSQLKLKINDLGLEFQAAKLQLSDVKNVLVATEEEKRALLAENSVVKSKLQEVELRMDSLQTQFGLLNEQNSILQSKLEEAEKGTNDLKFERDRLLEDNISLKTIVEELQAELGTDNDRVNHLEKLISSLEEQKESILSEFSVLTGKLRHAQLENGTLEKERDLLREEKVAFQKITDGLHNKMIDYEKRLADGVSEMQHLKNTLKVQKAEVLHEVQLMINTSKGELVEMVMQKDDLEQKIKELVQVSLENEALLKKLEDGLRSKISEKEALNEKYEDLLGKYKQLEKSAQEVVNLNQQLTAIREEKESLRTVVENLQIENENLKSQLGASTNQVSHLSDRLSEELEKTAQEVVILKATESERDTLIEEKSALLVKINEGTAIQDEFRAQIEQLEGEKSQLTLKNNDLNLELQAANLQLSDVKNVVVATEEEKRALFAENSVVKSKLQEVELRMDSLQTQFVSLNEQNSILQSKVEEAEKDTNDLKLERDLLLEDNMHLKNKVEELQTRLETENERVNHLEKLISSAEEQKESILSEFSVLTGKLRHSQLENGTLEKDRDLLREESIAFKKIRNELHNKMIDYEKRLEDGAGEMQHLKETLKVQRAEVLYEVQLMIDTFKGDLVELAKQKDDLDQKIKELVQVSLGNEESLKKIEDGARNKFLEREALNEKYEDLLAKHKQLEDDHYETVAKLDFAETKLEEMVVKDQLIQKFEIISADQKNEICKLNESYKGIQEKFLLTEVAKTDVDKEMQRLEVQLRLSNQKLKITETEYKEKEERSKNLVELLQEELRLLDKQVLKWSGEFRVLNSEYMQTKLFLGNGLEITFNEFQEMKSTSLENMRHTKMQLAECISELQELKTRLDSELHQKKKLQNEKDEQGVRLRYQQGVILDLKDEASRKGMELSEKAKQLKVLELRVTELGMKLKEQEREVLDKDEEKREAIRQLCLLIEYHWENCNQLARYIASVRRSMRPS